MIKPSFWHQAHQVAVKKDLTLRHKKSFTSFISMSEGDEGVTEIDFVVGFPLRLCKLVLSPVDLTLTYEILNGLLLNLVVAVLSVAIK